MRVLEYSWACLKVLPSWIGVRSIDGEQKAVDPPVGLVRDRVHRRIVALAWVPRHPAMAQYRIRCAPLGLSRVRVLYLCGALFRYSVPYSYICAATFECFRQDPTNLRGGKAGRIALSAAGRDTCEECERPHWPRQTVCHLI